MSGRTTEPPGRHLGATKELRSSNDKNLKFRVLGASRALASYTSSCAPAVSMATKATLNKELFNSHLKRLLDAWKVRDMILERRV